MNEIHVIPGVLSATELGQVECLLASASFEDGRATASGMAKAVKNNLQAGSKTDPELIRLLTHAIQRNGALRLLSQPRKMTSLLVSRYEVGMAYGTHSDSAVIHGVRGDLSFTLFLVPPEAYEGGELVIESGLGDRKIKLAAGALVLYPTGVLHRVAPIVRGARVAAVGWIQSSIRDPRQREVMTDLEVARRRHLKEVGHDRTADLLLKVSHNLRRLWEE